MSYQIIEDTEKKGDSFFGGIPEGITNMLSNFGVGVGSEIGKTGMGLAELVLKGGAKLTGSKFLGEAATEAKTISQKVFEEPFKKQLGSMSGQLGKFTGIGAVYAAPTKAITTSQSILANVSKPLAEVKGFKTMTKLLARVAPEAVITGVTEYARTGGDIEAAKSMGTFTGILSGGLGLLGNLGRATYWPALEESVTKALGLSGKTTAGRVQPQIERKIAGLSVLKEYAPQTIVKGAGGVEKQFIPEEATFSETLQAWNSVREKVYNSYNTIVEQAGDTINTKIDDVALSLNNIINAARTQAHKDGALILLKDIVNNFSREVQPIETTLAGGAGVMRQGGGVLRLKALNPQEIQTYLSDLYTEASAAISGRSDKAYSELAAMVAGKFRQKLDDMITDSMGPEYSQLRSQYGALKEIEQDLIKRFRQEVTKIGGGLNDYAYMFNAGDLITSFMYNQPEILLTSGVRTGVLTLLNKLKQPDRYIQRAFKLINQKEVSPFIERMFGGQGGRQLSPYEEKIQNTISKYYSKIKSKAGLSLEDISKKTSPAVGQTAYKGETDLTTKFLNYAKGKTTLSRQEIMDFARRPELKKGEADLLMKKLEEFEPKVSTKLDIPKEEEFAFRKQLQRHIYDTQDYTPDFAPGYETEDILGWKKFLEEIDKFDEGLRSTEPKVPFTHKKLRLESIPDWAIQKTRNVLTNEDDYIVLYRGLGRTDTMPNSFPFGSWSTNKSKAEEFLGGGYSDPGRPGNVFSVKVPKDKILLHYKAFPDLADESEVIVDSLKVKNGIGISDKVPSKLPAQEFADSLRRDLLELKPVKVKEPQFQGVTIQANEELRNFSTSPIRLKPNNYEEVIFESPIITNGSSHYPNSKNYFAHARGDEVVESGKKIWREQEIQSDLLQKEGLENLRLKVGGETRKASSFDSVSNIIEEKDVPKLPIFKKEDIGIKNLSNDFNKEVPQHFILDAGDDGKFVVNTEGFNYARYITRIETKESIVTKNKLVEQNIEKLQSFTNDRFGERIMRERIKEKAQKGYEKYRLPTGETIGKIEGFEAESWFTRPERGFGESLTVEKLKIGDPISHTREGTLRDWIITDILGDGRFKAVPKSSTLGEMMIKNKGNLEQAMKDTAEIHHYADWKNQVIGETFDLTGKSNPQYRRYQDWGKFLKNKYGGKQITDKQGNTWMEIDLKKEYAKMPVEAFGIGLLALENNE